MSEESHKITILTYHEDDGEAFCVCGWSKMYQLGWYEHRSWSGALTTVRGIDVNDAISDHENRHILPGAVTLQLTTDGVWHIRNDSAEGVFFNYDGRRTGPSPTSLWIAPGGRMDLSFGLRNWHGWYHLSGSGEAWRQGPW